MRIRLKTFLLLVSPLLLVVAAAHVQWGTVGLPALPLTPELTPETAAGTYGFPAWLRVTHYVNFLFLVLLIRSGLQILADHPRTVLERPLHARNRVTPPHPGRRAQGPPLHRQG